VKIQAVILAGGLGTRLGPITKHTPKSMVLVSGVPYLELQLRLLREQSITDIVILTGYLGDQIEEYFSDGGKLGLSIRYSREQSALGTGGALRKAQSLLAEEFLVLYGDSYLPIDYRAVYMRLKASACSGIVVVYDNRLGDTSVESNIELNAENRVIRYDKRNPGGDHLSYVEAGVLAFRASVLNLIPAGRAVSLENEIFPQLITEGKLIGYITSQRFYDIGTPDRLKALEQLFANDCHTHSVSH
jgi:NDP-sugar pyrophosphorylase family protein